jgi:hypothetical protein
MNSSSSFRMSQEAIENYIRQTIEAQTAPEVTIARQGGEPAPMGFDSYRHGRTAAEIMAILAQEAAAQEMRFAGADRNSPCPCGSGLKCRSCHGACHGRHVTQQADFKSAKHQEVCV